MKFLPLAMAGAAAVSLSASARVGQAQPEIALEQLTVPASRLPAGCRLPPKPWQPIGDAPVGRHMWAGLPITSNPWLGTERRIVARLRERLDGPAAVPDGPPLSSREAAAFHLRLADDVEEAYAAVYNAEDQFMFVVVSAMRLTTSVPRDEWLVQRRNSSARRISSGRTTVGVSGERSACFAAVWTYIESLFKA